MCLFSSLFAQPCLLSVCAWTHMLAYVHLIRYFQHYCCWALETGGWEPMSKICWQYWRCHVSATQYMSCCPFRLLYLQQPGPRWEQHSNGAVQHITHPNKCYILEFLVLHGLINDSHINRHIKEISFNLSSYFRWTARSKRLACYSLSVLGCLPAEVTPCQLASLFG